MTEDRDIDVPHETASFVAELRRLADALESGEAFTIHMDGEEVTIPDGAQLSIAHEREDGEVELEFQITWSLAEDEDDEDEDDEEEQDMAEDEAESKSKDGEDAKAEETEPTPA